MRTGHTGSASVGPSVNRYGRAWLWLLYRQGLIVLALSGDRVFRWLNDVRLLLFAYVHVPPLNVFASLTGTP